MESEFLGWLQQRLRTSPRAPLGLRDDAAWLRLGAAGGCVLTTDMLMDGVDFQLACTDARRAGRKALAVNLSDLAAMAASPRAALVSLALPRAGGRRLAEQLYEGLLALADEYDVTIAGGDTNSWDGPLVISVTAVGEATSRGVLQRSGGRPGDVVVVTGTFGGSILGRHLDFSPRVREALHLHSRYELHAGIDVSDGLSLDLARLAEASGCGAVIEPRHVPIAREVQQLVNAEGPGKSPLAHALSDGEDFELIVALSPEEAARLLREQPLEVPLTAIGTLTSELGLWEQVDAAHRVPLAPQGYLHDFTP
jgi:thiamine-monophosphate kinase